MGAVILARYLNMEVEDTTKTCLVQKRSQQSNCSFSKTTCGLTEAPEQSSSTSLSTMATSTSSALSGENRHPQYVTSQSNQGLRLMTISCSYIVCNVNIYSPVTTEQWHLTGVRCDKNYFKRESYRSQIIKELQTPQVII